MRPAELWGRTLRRSDTRAALAIAGLLLLVMGLQGLLLFAYVAMESLEEANRWMDHTLRVAQHAEAWRGSGAELLEELHALTPGAPAALRMRDADGAVVAERGVWPPAERTVSGKRAAEDSDSDSNLASSRWLRRDNFLVGSAQLASGASVELALPLSHFASETAEIARGLGLIVAGSGIAALLIAVAATARAFAPLRAGTALLRGVDARNLGHRLPLRGTGDPVDRHAETLNAVLASVDAAFSRLRSFSSDVAHELRTPLNRIRNVSEVALLADDEPELRSALEGVQRSAEELSAVVESLLLLAELDDGGARGAGAPIDVDAWIARTAETYEPLFAERGVKLVARSDAGSIHGDRRLFDRVLLNLLENALDHVSSGGSVEIHAVRSPVGVAIAVADSGPGVPARERERIFERFVRLGPARRSGTSGLGLAVARAVARAYGGDLGVADAELGGARFVWWIPLAAGPD